MSDPTAAPATEKPSFIEDLMEIWFAPSKVFARRAKSGFFLMMIFITLAIGGLFLANRGVLQPIFDGEYNRQMAQVMKDNPNMTADMVAQGKKFADMAQTFGIWIGIPIAMLFLGLFTWIVGKLLGAEEFGYGAATMVACWAYLPKVLESILVSVQGLVLDMSGLTGRFQLSAGVGRFMDPNMNPGILGLLGRIDVFTIWVSLLLAIGICVVGKLPKSRIVPAAAIMWLCGAIPAMWQVLMGAMKG